MSTHAEDMSGRAERWALPAFALAAVVLHLATALNYGIFRDEFYYIACAKRLAWGYVDHPPLSLAVLALVQALLGDGQFALRLVPALVGGLNVYLAGRITRELGGKPFAQAFAALLVLVAPVFRGVSSYYSMNVFDHCFWALALLVFARILATGNPQWWLAFGVICGLGLLNKISVLFLGFGLIVGLLCTPHRRHFLHWQLYAGGAIALLLFLPHILWEMANGWPMVEFTANAAKYKNAPIGPLGFFTAQLLMFHPLAAPLWLTGLIAGFFASALKPYRALAWLFLAVFLLLAFTYGKDYYLAPAYFALVPLAALFLDQLTAHRAPALRYAAPATLAITFLFLVPLAVPVLPIDTFLKYQAAIGLKPPASERGTQADELPQHFSDRFGWEEMAQSTQAAIRKLSPAQREGLVIFVSNYGRAYALEYFANEYGLPPAYTTHNNGYLWGPPPGEPASVLILTGDSPEELAEAFGQVTELGQHTAPYARGSESRLRIYHCAQPKYAWYEVWPRYKNFI